MNIPKKNLKTTIEKIIIGFVILYIVYLLGLLCYHDKHWLAIGSIFVGLFFGLYNWACSKQ